MGMKLFIPVQLHLKSCWVDTPRSNECGLIFSPLGFWCELPVFPQHDIKGQFFIDISVITRVYFSKAHLGLSHFKSLFC